MAFFPPDSLYLNMHEESAEEDRQNLSEAVVRYFDETGCRGLYFLPLNDDQGRVGLLLYVSSVPDFLELPHTEMIKVLAGQTTVAIRNALLYREVPLISLLEPLMQKRAALLRTSGSRRMGMAVLTAAVVLIWFVPLPMRVSGDATVAPQHMVTVAAPVDGNVEAVYAHEGQRVAAGDVLGTLNDWQWRTDLSATESKYQQAELMMENDLARGSAQAGADRAQTVSPLRGCASSCPSGERAVTSAHRGHCGYAQSAECSGQASGRRRAVCAGARSELGGSPGCRSGTGRRAAPHRREGGYQT